MNIIKKLSFHLFPGYCILCGQRTKRDFDLCKKCEHELPYKENIFIHNVSINKFVALFAYQEPIDHLITKLKFNKKLIYAEILGTLLMKKIRASYTKDAYPNLIIPVPLHKKRLKERGYNQALEISCPIAKQLNIKIDTISCKRNKNTLAQSSLSATKRSGNIKNAFIVKKPIHGKHIAIVDDVVTTGSTVSELAKAIAKTGDYKIDIWCIAKT
ncbi:MAG: ComF family protein [Gammaproteobacteria bacterium]|nr:ComF family protein [Gammaproteobacteria bacterium]